MKKMKKLASVLLTLVMALSMTVTAFAQTVTPDGATGEGSITISNASKGETYAVYKLFDATVSADGKNINYTGNIPSTLSTYFTKDSAGNITATAEAKADDVMSDGLKDALTEWVKTATKTVTAVSDGSTLTFDKLAYGYYVVTTTQGNQVISVDSTMPNAEIVDKNSMTPTVEKKVNDADVAIGQKVIYTATFKTANFIGEGESAEKVYKYVITDTLPEFLKDVQITKITIDDTEYKVNDEVPQFDDNKSITIPWVNKDGDSIYKNGDIIVLTYEATVTDKVVIDGTNGNINRVTLKPYKKDNKPFDEEYHDDEKIFSYATALKKVDEQENALAGAKFAAKGLVVTGSAGNYTVVSYDPDATENGTVMECDDKGNLVIKGLPSDVSLVLTETEAPNGYNKLTETVTMPVQKIGEVVTTTSTKIYYDAEGNVVQEETSKYTTEVKYNDTLAAVAFKVVNKAGIELPSTGGMGTTILYVIGTILVLGAAILLVVRRRMNMNK